MRVIKMTAKRAGTCTNCHKAIVPGQRIAWAKGVGAAHVDCATAGYLASVCSQCNGSGLRWNQTDCGACDGTGKRQDSPINEDGPCSDRGYEDDCARQCGL